MEPQHLNILSNGHYYHDINDALQLRIFIKENAHGYYFIYNGVQYGHIEILEIYPDFEIIESWCKYAEYYIEVN